MHVSVATEHILVDGISIKSNAGSNLGCRLFLSPLDIYMCIWTNGWYSAVQAKIAAVIQVLGRSRHVFDMVNFTVSRLTCTTKLTRISEG